MGIVRSLYDGLVNMASGRGGPSDKSAYASYMLRPLTGPEIEARYRSSWIARKIVDIPADDMTRAGRDWQAEKEQIDAIEATERKHQVWNKLRQALVLGRLGGGAFILGIGGEDAALPVNPRTIAKDSLRYIHVLSRWHMRLGDRVLDPESELFGQPSFFEITTGGGAVRVHPSRVIPFKGLPVPETGFLSMQDQWFWGDSVLQAVDDAVKNADAAQGGFASLIEEAKIDIIKIPQLTSSFASAEYEGLLTKRLQAAATLKSLHNALIIDAGNGQPGSGEEWDVRQITWSGMTDLIKVYIELVAGAADIPATRLLGTSPRGMNATGESDLNNYFQMIASRQRFDVQPVLDRLDDVMLPSALGTRDPSIYYEFAPLNVLGEKDEALVEYQGAQTVQIYANSGTVPIDALSKAVQNRMIESGQWPGLEAALEQAAPITAEPPVDPNAPDPSALQAANENTVQKLRQQGSINADQAISLLADAQPRSLYVQRKLVNASDFIAWAKGQGFTTTLPAGELHVTIAFSRQPVDWMKVGASWSQDDKGQFTVPPGGARIVEKLGDKGAVVLLFSSSELSWRHEDIRQAGASFDFEQYQPHITITYTAPADLDLSKVQPFQGKLVFGPEIFQEVTDGWEQTVEEE
jgi:uncharacterized protein